MIITISGKSGSGKSTLSHLLAAKLGLKRYSIGELRRKMAQERGITIAQLNKLGEKDDFTDRQVDEFQAELGKKEDNFVCDGRTSFHFIPHSIKIYLDCTVDKRAERVFKDERVSEHFETVEEAKKALLQRDESDAWRYKKYYHLDMNNTAQYDLILDSATKAPEETVQEVLDYLEAQKLK